jgi:pantetheine-phosphate adenylyltransferase
MIADGDLAHVSSSLIKQIAPLADDEALARFLPRPAARALRAKLDQARDASARR